MEYINIMSAQLQQILTTLADETRLRCALLLWSEGELCVCELQQALDLSQPKISKHLAVLRAAGLVADRREGTWIHYRISPELPKWAVDILKAAADAATQRRLFATDRKALKSAAVRPPSRCA